MKKTLMMALTMASVLSAATCSDKSKAYSNGYTSMVEQLKDNTDNDDKAKRTVMLSSYANTVCDIGCQSIAYKKPSAESPKKKAVCFDICMKGAQDAFNGAKPKMKLCE